MIRVSPPVYSENIRWIGETIRRQKCPLPCQRGWSLGVGDRCVVGVEVEAAKLSHLAETTWWFSSEFGTFRALALWGWVGRSARALPLKACRMTVWELYEAIREAELWNPNSWPRPLTKRRRASCTARVELGLLVVSWRRREKGREELQRPSCPGTKELLCWSLWPHCSLFYINFMLAARLFKVPWWMSTHPPWVPAASLLGLSRTQEKKRWELCTG